MTCQSTNYIKVFRGDDTNWNGQNLLNFVVSSQTANLATMTARFIVGEIVFDNISLSNQGAFSINLTHDQTSRLPWGLNEAILQILDSQERIKTVSNTIPLYITNQLFEEQTGVIRVNVPEGSPVDITLQVGVAYATQEALDLEIGARQQLQAQLQTKQAVLVSGTNIKTINNNSILGSGDLSIDSLPSQSGNSGKFLTTDGTDASWATVDALPVQTGNNGKFLTTNGSSASWAALPEVDIDGNSITKNSDNELQAVAVIEQNNSYPIKEWVGTKQEYDSIQNKDSRTRYEVTDETDATSIVVDSALSNSSENPLQNKAIYTAMQAKQDVSNLVTSVSSSSTDAQYPSAKLFYDTCGDIETLINAL